MAYLYRGDADRHGVLFDVRSLRAFSSAVRHIA
jgi:hypothetical protein